MINIHQTIYEKGIHYSEVLKVSQALSFKNMPVVLQIALLKIFRCAVGVHFISNYVYFTRFRCAENLIPQDHFRCVMVFNHTHMPQKEKACNTF